MSVFNSLSVSVLIVLLVAGLAVGLSVSGTDLVNPNTSQAEAEAIRIDAAHQQAVYKLQEQSAQAKTEAEIQSIKRQQKILDAQYEHDIQALTQDLEHRDFAFRLWMNVLAFVGGMLAVAITIVAVTWVSAKIIVAMRNDKAVNKPHQTISLSAGRTIHPAPKYEPSNPWTSPTYRRQKVKAARQEERNQRKEIATQIKMYKDPARISKEEYKRRPLAGD